MRAWNPEILVDEALLQKTLEEMNRVVYGFLYNLRRQKGLAEYNNLAAALDQGYVILGGDDACLSFKVGDNEAQNCCHFDFCGMQTAAGSDGEEVTIQEVLDKSSLAEKRKIQ